MSEPNKILEYEDFRKQIANIGIAMIFCSTS